VISAQPELLCEALPEIKPLLPLHYEALSLHKDRHALSPQYEVYLARERNGELSLVTLRHDGALVGYWISFVAPGLHYSTCLTGTMDIWFIAKEYRVGKAPLLLIRAVEKELKRRGVHLWFAGEKLHNPCGRLFKFVDMQPVETYYAKWLRDEPMERH